MLLPPTMPSAGHFPSPDQEPEKHAPRTEDELVFFCPSLHPARKSGQCLGPCVMLSRKWLSARKDCAMDKSEAYSTASLSPLWKQWRTFLPEVIDSRAEIQDWRHPFIVATYRRTTPEFPCTLFCLFRAHSQGDLSGPIGRKPHQGRRWGKSLHIYPLNPHRSRPWRGSRGKGVCTTSSCWVLSPVILASPCAMYAGWQDKGQRQSLVILGIIKKRKGGLSTILVPTGTILNLWPA